MHKEHRYTDTSASTRYMPHNNLGSLTTYDEHKQVVKVHDSPASGEVFGCHTKV